MTIGEGAAGTFSQTGGTTTVTLKNAGSNDLYIGNIALKRRSLECDGRHFHANQCQQQPDSRRPGFGWHSDYRWWARNCRRGCEPSHSERARGGGNGIVNLYANGVLSTSALKKSTGTGTSTVNFDGGTLKAKSSSGATLHADRFQHRRHHGQRPHRRYQHLRCDHRPGPLRHRWQPHQNQRRHADAHQHELPTPATPPSLAARSNSATVPPTPRWPTPPPSPSPPEPRSNSTSRPARPPPTRSKNSISALPPSKSRPAYMTPATRPTAFTSQAPARSP